jgi:hypothetical protein
VIEQLFLAQNGVNRLGHGGTFTRAEAPVITEKAGHYGIRRMVEFECEPDQFGAGV